MPYPVLTTAALLGILYNDSANSLLSTTVTSYTDYTTMLNLMKTVDSVSPDITEIHLESFFRNTEYFYKNQSLSSKKLDDEEIREIIHECYTQNLTLGGIAARFYLSESYLSRKFKKLFHLNVIQYIKTVRINYAKRYLIQTAVPVGEIANLVGYDDEKYFSRIFKEIEGITPNAYRQRHRFT